MVEEHSERTTWIEPLMTELSSVLRWTDYRKRGVGQAPDIELTFLGWLLVLGLVTCLSRSYFFCRALIWLPAVFYLVTTLGVGDAVRRYLQPVDWVGFVIIAIGLDTVTTLVAQRIAGLRREPQSAPVC